MNVSALPLGQIYNDSKTWVVFMAKYVPRKSLAE